MVTVRQITTAQQLSETPGLGRCELVRGELVMMTPAGFEHGHVVMNIAGPLKSFVKQQSLGVVTGAETGFQIAREPDTVRAPDVAFVCTERLPEAMPTGFFHGAPDLAVEVLSPNDRASELLGKVQDWLGAGCRVVWVVDPATQTVSIYRRGAEVTALKTGDELTGDDVLPDFRLAVAEIFAA